MAREGTDTQAMEGAAVFRGVGRIIVVHTNVVVINFSCCILHFVTTVQSRSESILSASAPGTSGFYPPRIQIASPRFS